jgi:hypothetical protein
MKSSFMISSSPVTSVNISDDPHCIPHTPLTVSNQPQKSANHRAKCYRSSLTTSRLFRNRAVIDQPGGPEQEILYTLRVGVVPVWETSATVILSQIAEDDAVADRPASLHGQCLNARVTDQTA